ncbi:MULTISPECIES: hypothetical protein [Mycolicibacterium]|uniref:hypothetical protein n=1 Tax=Mycolicibacterium TaxID=1866885 RepID=UPI000769A533|nr:MULTISPECIES: hypothetical protein [Mycolicibacterium]MCT7373123.1 hypothetical protein [Mycolicibacterium llatzerense]
MIADFYLVKDGTRIQALAAHVDGRLFCYVPDVDAFVYNKPLSVDFMVDRNKTYNHIDVTQARRIMAEGCIGAVGDRGSQTLIDWAYGEPHRLGASEVLDAGLGEPGEDR